MVKGRETVSRKNSIKIEFDEESRDYYIIWQPIIIGAGRTGYQALEDLREAAHHSVDTLIDLKLIDNTRGKEN